MPIFNRFYSFLTFILLSIACQEIEQVDEKIVENIEPIKIDSIHTESVQKRTEPLKVYDGSEANIEFLNIDNESDSIEYRDEYIVRIKIKGIPDTLLRVRVVNAKINRSESLGEYKIKPQKSSQLVIHVGYKDTLDSDHNWPVSEKIFWIK